MADQKVRINIGTSYDGSGVSKTLGALGNLSKDVGKVTGGLSRMSAAVGALGGTFDSMGGKAAQTLGQLTSALGMIATGGTIGIIMGGIQGWVTIFNSLKGETKKTKDETQSLKKQIEELSESYNKVKQNCNDAITANNSLATSISNVANALTRLNTAQGTEKQIQLGIQNARAVANAPAEEKGIVAAQGEVESAKLKGEQAIQNAATALQAAKERVGVFEKNLGEANRQLNAFTDQELALKSALETANDQFKGAMDAGVKGKALYKYSRAIDNATDALEEFMEMTKGGEEARKAVRDADQQLLQANLELRTAEQNEANAREQAAASIEVAEQKLADEEEKAREQGINATWAEVSVRAERAAQMKEEERAEQQLKDAIKEHEQDEKDLEKATKELKDAQLEYAYRLRRAQIAEANTNWMTAAGGAGGAWNGGSAIPIGQIIGNGINGKNRYDPRNNASIHDTGYNERVQAGYERNAQSQGYGLSARDRDFQRQIDEKLAGGQDVSKKDMERYKDINSRDPERQREKAEREAEKAREEAESKQKEKDQAEQKLKDDVAEIVKLMNKLGLK